MAEKAYNEHTEYEALVKDLSQQPHEAMEQQTSREVHSILAPLAQEHFDPDDLVLITVTAHEGEPNQEGFCTKHVQLTVSRVDPQALVQRADDFHTAETQRQMEIEAEIKAQEMEAKETRPIGVPGDSPTVEEQS